MSKFEGVRQDGGEGVGEWFVLLMKTVSNGKYMWEYSGKGHMVGLEYKS